MAGVFLSYYREDADRARQVALALEKAGRVAANDWNYPRAQFYAELKRLVDAGFGKRIMFGSDPGPFPTAIGAAIKSIQEAPFLSAAQKRDILYNNAARFLRLSQEQIARDHRP